MTDEAYDVVIVGAGPAGLSAGVFTGRHGMDTLIASAGDPILRRNAHLENYPGFPAGVNARVLLDMMTDQAERSGCAFRDAEVVDLERVGDEDAEGTRFAVETAAGDRIGARFVIAATKNGTGFLEGLSEVGIVSQGSKEFVDVDERGRTGVEGLYAAGRVALKPHQTIVCAGHGAEVAVTLLEEADVGFYHDWVAPEGYFTGRGRDVPPGCEEIDGEEFRRREAASLDVMRGYFAEAHPDEPQQHPSVAADDD